MLCHARVPQGDRRLDSHDPADHPTRQAVAAGLITSKQIKDGTIQVKDINKEARASLKGTAGAQGARGLTGTPISVQLGAGSYVILAKFEINNSSAVTARPSCVVNAAGDTDNASVGTSANETDDDTASATLTVVHTSAAAGAGRDQCRRSRVVGARAERGERDRARDDADGCAAARA